MNKVNTFWAKIFCGLQRGYSDYSHSINWLDYFCQKYVDKIGLCVTITETEFIYVGGSEKGAIIELINYPRFPCTNEELKTKAIELASILKKELGQNRISIMFPDETIMLGEKDE